MTEITQDMLHTSWGEKLALYGPYLVAGWFAGGVAGELAGQAGRPEGPYIAAGAVLGAFSLHYIREKFFNSDDDQSKLQKRTVIYGFKTNPEEGEELAKALHDIRGDCQHLIRKMSSIRAIQGNDGKGYIVSIKTPNGKVTLKGMSDGEFSDLRDKVAKTKTPLSVVDISKDEVIETHTIGGEFISEDNRIGSKWRPGKVVIDLKLLRSSIREYSKDPEKIEQYLRWGYGGDSSMDWISSTYYDKNGTPMSESEKRYGR